MKHLLRTLTLGVVVLVPSLSGGQARNDYPLQPVSLTKVHLTDSFWAGRLDINECVVRHRGCGHQ
jgi:hypothetical protein